MSRVGEKGRRGGGWTHGEAQSQWTRHTGVLLVVGPETVEHARRRHGDVLRYAQDLRQISIDGSKWAGIECVTAAT